MAKRYKPLPADRLNDAAIDSAKESLHDWQADGALETGLGLALANWAGLNGKKIAEVAAAAMEHGNHHAEAEVLRSMFGRKK